jgi:regulator of PEP synthase PpsR (kinase-PPPase family)
MEQQAKPKKEMTPEQLEILKARLIKAREAKLTRDNKRYVANKEQIKEEVDYLEDLYYEMQYSSSYY